MARTKNRTDQTSLQTLEDETSCTAIVGDSNVFAVEKVLDIRAVTTKVEYYVKWENYSDDHNQWVPAKNLSVDLRRAFSQKRNKKDIEEAREELRKDSLKRKEAKRLKKEQSADDTSQNEDSTADCEVTAEVSEMISNACAGKSVEELLGSVNGEKSTKFMAESEPKVPESLQEEQLADNEINGLEIPNELIDEKNRRLSDPINVSAGKSVVETVRAVEGKELTTLMAGSEPKVPGSISQLADGENNGLELSKEFFAEPIQQSFAYPINDNGYNSNYYSLNQDPSQERGLSVEELMEIYLPNL